MEYNQRFSRENRARIIELIASLAEIDLAEVNAAVDKHGFKKVLEDPTLISETAYERLKDLKQITSFMNQEGG